MIERDACLYTPFYCEENAWHLVQRAELAALEPAVLFVSNPTRSCALWHQRAAPPGHPIVWDYHVVVLTRGAEQARIWDLDTRLAFPLAARDWLDHTFWGTPRLEARYRPRFRLVEAERFARTFASDRSHMRDARGAFTQPPPPWPIIATAEATMNLDAFVDTMHPFSGQTFALEGLRRWLEP